MPKTLALKFTAEELSLLRSGMHNTIDYAHREFSRPKNECEAQARLEFLMRVDKLRKRIERAYKKLR